MRTPLKSKKNFLRKIHDEIKISPYVAARITKKLICSIGFLVPAKFFSLSKIKTHFLYLIILNLQKTGKILTPEDCQRQLVYN